jgi:ATP synthase F1 complex assembly factor 2
VFQVTSEPLALAIANEWQSQGKEIKVHLMNLTGLTNTFLDNPMRLTPETITDQLVEYLGSDTLCFPVREPEELAALQEEKWDPILAWFRERHRCEAPVTEGVLSLEVPLETRRQLERHLLSFPQHALLGFQFVVDNLKSLLLGLALSERRLSVDQAVALSRLELDFQVQKWGRIPYAHDMEEELIRSRVSAGLLFFLLHIQSSHEKVSKLSNG